MSTRIAQVRSGEESLEITWKDPDKYVYEHKHFILEDGFGRMIILDAALSNHVQGITLVGFGLDETYGEFIQTKVIKVPYGTEGG